MNCEKRCIRRLKKGKKDALNYVVDNYSPLVKGTVRKILFVFKDEGIIEECINDVFLAVWNNANKFKGEGKDFKKWIYIISKFKAIDYYRANIKNKEITIDNIEIKNEDSMEDKVIAMENREKIMKILSTLDEVDKNIFILKFFLGYKSEEIAIKLKLTKSAVDNRLYRGKIKLRGKMANINLEVI